MWMVLVWLNGRVDMVPSKANDTPVKPSAACIPPEFRYHPGRPNRQSTCRPRDRNKTGIIDALISLGLDGQWGPRPKPNSAYRPTLRCLYTHFMGFSGKGAESGASYRLMYPLFGFSGLLYRAPDGLHHALNHATVILLILASDLHRGLLPGQGSCVLARFGTQPARPAPPVCQNENTRSSPSGKARQRAVKTFPGRG